VGFSFLQTAMINGVSQSLAPREAGIGMGVFNLVGVISGAVGAAVAGRLLGAPWMHFSLFHAPITGSSGANLLAVFAIVAAAGGLRYLRALRARSVSAG
jgi:MFS transporter, DHA2 family, metal-tetracycline-proton antiporter